MNIKRIVLIATLFTLLGVVADAQDKTTINDRGAAQMLLGKHKLSLQ